MWKEFTHAITKMIMQNQSWTDHRDVNLLNPPKVLSSVQYVPQLSKLDE